MLWSGIEGEARRLLAGASRHALIVSPFIKVDALERLLGAVSDGVEIELYTRWRPEEVARRVSDTAVLPVVTERGGSVHLIGELHAKVVAADLRDCLLGSANVTGAGMGTSARPNLEVVTRLDAAEGTLALFARELRARSIPATEEERRRIEEEAERLRPVLPPEPEPDAADHSVGAATAGWMPRFRSPDRLFRLYSDPDWILSAKADDPALLDLLAMGLAGGLDRAEFDTWTRNALLGCEAVRLIDATLSEPQRFGAINARLSAVMPGAGHAERQAATQTLVRWLLHFAPDHYRLDTPNYSEILSRR